MPRRSFKNLAQEKKDAILNAAMKEFAENGFANASYNQIILQCGLSKGSMYYYFDDKEDLYLTVLQVAFEKLGDVLGDFPQVKSAEEFWATVEEQVHKYLTLMIQDPILLGIVRSIATVMKRGELKVSHTELIEPHNQKFLDFMKQGQKIGAVRTDLPDELLISLHQAIHEAMDLWFYKHFDSLKKVDWEKLTSKMVKIHQRLLEPDPNSTEVIT